ncbi:hypothetical protein CRG98_018452 [Punica granatum]|uniref:Uncharacterized protein n=1 Tax=Punica granatum TaxID=22663 RepID=A0A2I0JXZ9_PUNGR|nr:hypothetical protein CRG98_018452 [Punica granatum]
MGVSVGPRWSQRGLEKLRSRSVAPSSYMLRVTDALFMYAKRGFGQAQYRHVLLLWMTWWPGGSRVGFTLFGTVDSMTSITNQESETSRKSAVGVFSLFPKYIYVPGDRCVLRLSKTNLEALGVTGIGWYRPWALTFHQTSSWRENPLERGIFSHVRRSGGLNDVCSVIRRNFPGP